MYKNPRFLQIEQLFGLILEVLKTASFEIDAKLSPFKEAFSELSVQIIVHLTIEVIYQVLSIIKGLRGLHWYTFDMK